jgi:hypothetical protein
VGNEVLLEKVQLNFSFQNKFIIVLPCGLLVDNYTFSKMCVFKSYWLHWLWWLWKPKCTFFNNNKINRPTSVLYRRDKLHCWELCYPVGRWPAQTQSPSTQVISNLPISKYGIIISRAHVQIYILLYYIHNVNQYILHTFRGGKGKDNLGQETCGQKLQITIGTGTTAVSLQPASVNLWHQHYFF